MRFPLFLTIWMYGTGFFFYLVGFPAEDSHAESLKKSKTRAFPSIGRNKWHGFIRSVSGRIGVVFRHLFCGGPGEYL